MAEVTARREWKLFFWVAALFNMVIGAGALLDATWGSSEAISGVLIFCFGILYALVAREPERFAPALIAGILGKLAVVAMLGPPNWSVTGDPAVGAIVAGDLFFAIGFILFLARTRRHG